MSERMDIDFDDTLGEIQIDSEDFALLQQYEVAAAATRPSLTQHRLNQTQTQQRINDHTSWNHAQDGLMATQKLLAAQPTHTVTIEEQNIQDAPIQANTSGYGPEADRIIQDLQFQLKRLQVNTTDPNEELRLKEVTELKEVLRLKESIISQQKQELSRYRSQDTDTQKRIFPGPPPKQTKRRATTSQAAFRSSQSSIFSNQSTRSLSIPPAAPVTPKQSKLVSSETLPLLVRANSPAAPLSPASPSLIPNRTERLIHPVQIPIIEEPSTIDASGAMRLRRPKKKAFGRLFDDTLGVTERNRKLFISLFTPIFQKWNVGQHQNTKDVNMSLSHEQIEEFSTIFSQQFIPEEGQCSSITLDKLKLLASDLRSYLIKTEYANGTIRLLLNVFNLFMPICIAEKLYAIIQHILIVINALVKTFKIVTDYLYKDFTFDENSLMTQFMKTIALFPLRDLQAPQVTTDHPDIDKQSYTVAKHLVKTYSTSANLIANTLYTKIPKEEATMIKSILELLHRVGCKDRKPRFANLMTDRCFMSLLHEKRQFDIVIKALQLLQTNFQNDDWISLYNDENCNLVKTLSKLLVVKQGPMTTKQWHILRSTSMMILQHMCSATELPTKELESMHKETFSKVYRFFELVYDDIKPTQLEATYIRDAFGDMVTIGLKLMCIIMETCPQNIFKLTNINADKCQLLPICFIDFPSGHSVHDVTSRMEQSIKEFTKKKRN